MAIGNGNNELTAILGVEIDPKAEQKLAKQLEGLLGGGKTDPAASPMRQYASELERLNTLTTELQRIYSGITKELQAHVALRDKELALAKAAQMQLGASSASSLAPTSAAGAASPAAAAATAASAAAAAVTPAAAQAAATAAANAVLQQLGAGGTPPVTPPQPPGAPGGGAGGTPPGGGGGGGGNTPNQRGFFTGWSTLFGGNRTQLNHGQQRHLVLAERLGDLARSAGGVTNSWLNVANRGWGGTEIAGALSDTISAIPVLGRIMGGFTSALDSIKGAGDLQDRWRMASYQVWRHGGEQARASFQNDWFGQGNGVDGMLRYGITREDSARLTMNAARSFGGTPSVEYAVEGRYGLGDELIGMRGALRRSGHQSSRGGEQEFAESIGIALSTNLERGRWGEIISNLTRVAANVSYGAVDFKSAVAIETLIGQLGKQYQGQTPQADAMRGALGQISTGAGGGLATVLATQQALTATGGDYAAAQMMIEAGVGSDRGLTDSQLKELIRNAPIAREFFAGRMDARKAAYLLHVTVWRNIPINRLYDLLVGMAAGAGVRTGADNATILDDTYNGDRPTVDQRPLNKTIGGERPHVRDVAGVGFDVQGPVNSLENRNGGSGPVTVPSQLQLPPVGPAFPQSRMTPPAPPPPTPTVPSSSSRPAHLDPGLWEHYGPDIRGAATTTQMSGYASRAQFNASDPFVDSWAEAEGQWATKPAHGLYDDRDHDASGNRLGAGMHRRHGSRDIFMPPGSPVRAPLDGVWVRSGDLNDVKASFGFYGEMRGSDSILYRFLHLEAKPTFAAGAQIRAGQVIGYTAKHKVGRSPSHLHLEAWQGDYKTGVQVDPFQKIGLRGINMMYTGAGSRDEWQRSGGESSLPTNGRSPVTSPSSVDGGALSPSTPAPQTSQRVDVSITVHDSRISVAKRIVPASGQVGQNYTRMG